MKKHTPYLLLVAMLLLTACRQQSADKSSTISSLKKVYDYPLYTMVYAGDYSNQLTDRPVPNNSAPAFGCSLFAALGYPDQRLFGRNFDWNFSPTLLLFTDPPEGYASVSTVDLEYFFSTDDAKNLDKKPAGDLSPDPVSTPTFLHNHHPVRFLDRLDDRLGDADGARQAVVGHLRRLVGPFLGQVSIGRHDADDRVSAGKPAGGYRLAGQHLEHGQRVGKAALRRAGSGHDPAAGRVYHVAKGVDHGRSSHRR
jgi:hypothetical protein